MKLLKPTIITVAATFALAPPAFAQQNMSAAEAAAITACGEGAGYSYRPGSTLGALCSGVVTPAVLAEAEAVQTAAAVTAAVATFGTPANATTHQGITAAYTWEGVSVPATPDMVVLRSVGNGQFTAEDIVLPAGWTFNPAKVRMSAMHPTDDTLYVINFVIKNPFGFEKDVLMTLVVDPAAPAGQRNAYGVDYTVF